MLSQPPCDFDRLMQSAQHLSHTCFLDDDGWKYEIDAARLPKLAPGPVPDRDCISPIVLMTILRKQRERMTARDYGALRLVAVACAT